MVGFHETWGIPTLQTTSTSKANFLHLSPRWCVRWVPTLESGRPRAARGELHHESRRYAASSRSGVWECRGTFNVRLVCREGSSKGQKQQVRRSVFAGLWSPAIGAGSVS